MTGPRLLTIAATLAALGVALGAFGAHGLAGRVAPADLATFETGARYHLIHAVALGGLAAWFDRRPSPRLVWAARLLLLGVAVFSGTLYLLVLTGQRWLGAITPIGGVSLIAGWLLVAAAGVDAARSDR